MLTPLTPSEENELAASYQTNTPVIQLCRRFGRSRATIWRLLKRLGIAIDSPGTRRIYTLNEEAFDVITEHSAYWTGFLMADGSITRQHNSLYVNVSVAERDKEHICKFRDFLGSNQPIACFQSQKNAHWQPMHQLNIASRVLAGALMRFGVVPRKSKSAQVIGLEHDRHFWRGAVDGDGCVMLQQRSDTIMPLLTLVGAFSLMSQFADFVAPIIDYRPNVLKAQTIFQVRLGFNRAIRVLHHLYDDCTVALDRKVAAMTGIYAHAERLKEKRSEPKICSIHGCGKKRTARGLCRLHYERQKRIGF